MPQPGILTDSSADPADPPRGSEDSCSGEPDPRDIVVEPDPPGEGARVELSVGAPAHGGHCVARLPDGGLVVFVRHALPGERVIAEITEVHRGHLRADAVEILDASPERVDAPCPYARPFGCGGCDLQHVAPPAQREWKAAVVREQLVRLAGLTPAEVDALGVRVTALPGLPGQPEYLGWRSRVRYTVDAAGRAGLLKHRSHEVVPVQRCLIAHPSIQALPVTDQVWPDAEAVAVLASSTGATVTRPASTARPRSRANVRVPRRQGAEADTAGDAGAPAVAVQEQAVGRTWTLPAEAFWQVHPAAPDTLAAAVLDLLAPRPGESAWDLYGGLGPFAAGLATAVGAGGRVTLVESVPSSAAAARANLADLPWVEVVQAQVERALARRRLTGPVDLVVLDPPRSGAGADVVNGILAAGPRAVAYVACDPAALARDVGTFRQAGWQLTALRAYDTFPMTHHIECIAILAGGSQHP